MSTHNERYLELLASVKREGMDKLMSFILRSDFFTAPASTRYHNSKEGGLCEHSLNVYDVLTHKVNNSINKDVFTYTNEQLILMALLHDICKTNYYVAEPKNRKKYHDNGLKSDSNGKFDWETYMGYTVDDKYPYGHGEKSVMMIEQFIKLEPVERYAIRWHMGFTEPKEYWGTLGAAIRKYPLILALHEADLEATYLLEKENGE